jgi:AcrR family transcriptional regulator
MIEESNAQRERSSPYHHGNVKGAMVRAAIQLIEDRREASFTIRELAKSVGVSHAAAYRHFRSKRELLAEIAEEGFERLQAAFDEALGQNEMRSCRARLRRLGNVYIRYALEHPGHFRTMFHFELQPYGDFPSLKEAAGRALDTLLTAVIEGIERRELVRRSAKGLAMVAWSTVHGAAFLLLDGQTSLGADEMIELVIERLDSGLARP